MCSHVIAHPAPVASLPSEAAARCRRHGRSLHGARAEGLRENHRKNSPPARPDYPLQAKAPGGGVRAGPLPLDALVNPLDGSTHASLAPHLLVSPPTCSVPDSEALSEPGVRSSHC